MVTELGAPRGHRADLDGRTAEMLAPKQPGHVVGRAIGQVPANRSDCLPWFHRDYGLRRLVLLPVTGVFIEPGISAFSIFERLQRALQHRGATAKPSARPPRG